MEAVSSAAPVCGACVFLVHALRSNLALLEAEERGFWPETAADSAAALQGTGWPEFINAESLEDFGDLAGLSRSGFGSEELNVAVAKRTQATREAIRDLQQQIAQKSPGAS